MSLEQKVLPGTLGQSKDLSHSSRGFFQGTERLCFTGLHQTIAKPNMLTGLCSEDEA